MEPAEPSAYFFSFKHHRWMSCFIISHNMFGNAIAGLH